jgi:hypothetical protein
MGKIIFWLVVVFAILFVLRLVNVAKSRGAGRAGKSKTPPPAAMVRCVECGVYLPQADARPVPKGFHCGQVNCSQHSVSDR